MLQKIKDENKNYKTANINGIFYLINDSNDELGYHFDNNIISDTNSIKHIISKKYSELKEKNINYIFNIVPDKPCILKDKLETFLNLKLKRPHADAIKTLNFVCDSYEYIIENANNEKVYFNFDTHLNSFGMYLVYCSIIKKLNCAPRNISNKKYITDIPGDLSTPLNNGDRDHSDMLKDNLPVISMESYLCVNHHIKSIFPINIFESTNLIGKKYSNHEKMLGTFGGDSTLEKYMLDFYYNPNANNETIILYFHDSNMMMCSDENGECQKEYLSYHFKYNYFCFGNFNMAVIDKIKPHIVVEQKMERFLNCYRG
jgi:hypothetical protein